MKEYKLNTMRRVTIHVGLHKTATTFLQSSVFPYVENYTLVTRPYTQLNHAFNKLQYADDSLYSEDEFRSAINTIDSDSVIFSDESFSGKPTFFSYINRAIIAKRLASVFPDANIILFIRDQKDIMVSHYSSYVKMPYGTAKITDLYRKASGTFEYDDYRKTPSGYDHNSIYYNTNDFHINLDCFKYTPLINLYTKYFENLHVFTYEDFKRDLDATVDRLSDIMQESIAVKSTQRENKSLNGSMLVKKRILNNILSPKSSKYLRKAMDTGLKIIPPFPADDLASIIEDHVGDYYEDDNKSLKQILPEINWSTFDSKYS